MPTGQVFWLQTMWSFHTFENVEIHTLLICVPLWNIHVFIGVIDANIYIYVKIPLFDIHIYIYLYINIFIYIYIYIIYPSNDLICCIVNLLYKYTVWRWYIAIFTCMFWLSNKTICTWFFPSLVLKRLYDAWYDADVQPPARPICNFLFYPEKSHKQSKITNTYAKLFSIYIYICIPAPSSCKT